MTKNVGILAMDIYFPPTCVQQVTDLASDFSFLSLIFLPVALSSVWFPRKWRKNERKEGRVVRF